MYKNMYQNSQKNVLECIVLECIVLECIVLEYVECGVQNSIYVYEYVIWVEQLNNKALPKLLE